MKKQEQLVRHDLKFAFHKVDPDCMKEMAFGINCSVHNGTLQFESMDNETVLKNLFFVDSKMPEILAYIALHCLPEGTSDVADVVEKLTLDNPLGICCTLFYKRKIQELLLILALGVDLTEKWDGSLPNVWSRTVKNSSGETMTYSLISKGAFEDYLLENSYLSA